MSVARILWASGPVLRARPAGAFLLREAVEVGPRRLLGEVVRLERSEITVQVYEDTTGLRPGFEVRGTGALLGVRVGPGLLGRMFDGLLRPLGRSGSQYVESGLSGERTETLRFRPQVRAGDMLSRGQPFGEAQSEGRLGLLVLLPPDVEGEVASIAAPGEYPESQPLVVVRRADGSTREIAMSHFWPVRTPRPIAERLAANEPLITGQRILDSLFPLALGGRATIPGGFGTGKTILLEALAKTCNADVIVYLGCGERGNEMAGVLEELPRLDDPRTGRRLMERTVIIANTSNMPVAAREGSIYTAVTVAEYFRDQGLNVALMADSTSRWAEALREVSGRLGELPGEGGYPAYLSSRIADFYERAGKARTLSGRDGSVTLLGSVSPPSGDFSEPVTSHTKRYVRSFWALDAKRAQARFYPAVNPLQSYSEDSVDVAAWWGEVYHQLGDAVRDPSIAGNEWLELRRRFLKLLDEHARLERMARIIGKDALPARQQLALFCAEVLNEAFLRQSAFSEIDRYAGPRRQALMMRALARFVARAERALAQGVRPERMAQMAALRGLQRMGEDVAEDRTERIAQIVASVEAELDALAAEKKTAHAA